MCVIQNPAVLTSKIFVNPAVVYNGQLITVSLVVTNSGQATASWVSPTALVDGITLTHAGIIDPVVTQISPSPTTYTVTGGKVWVYKWIYTASGDGSITFNSEATGIEDNTGNTLTTPRTGATITLLPSASLTSSMWLSSTSLSVGQHITVRMTVANNGVGTAQAYNIDVNPSVLSRIGTPGSLIFLTGPTIVDMPPFVAPYPTPVTRAVGEYVTFEWTYSASAVGTSNFSAQARGRDSGIGAITDIPLLSPQVSVLTPSSLAAAVTGFPATVNIGQNFTVHVTVSNLGGTPAVSGGSDNLFWGYNTALATLVSGPVPAIPADFAGNSRSVFEFRFTAASAGAFSVTASATAIDSNSGLPVSSSVATGNTIAINRPADLTSYVSGIPSSGTLSLDQIITVILTVSNVGDSRANGVLPAAPAIQYNSAGTTILLKNSPSVTPVNINGSSTARFTWTYSATGIGNVTFSVSAGAAIDNTSGAAVPYSDLNPSVSFNITPPMPNLVVNYVSNISAHNPVYYGEAITVIMNVSNIGTIAATAVTPSALPSVPAGIINDPATVSPGPAAIIPVGSNVSFTWIYNANPGPTAGAATIDLSVTGMSQGTQLPVSISDSTVITVKASGAHFSAEVSALPSTVAITQFITVVMTVTNDGQTVADTLVPITPVLSSGSTGAVTLLTSPTGPWAGIAVGTATSFTWTYSASAGGVLNFSTGVNWTYTDGLVSVPGVSRIVSSQVRIDMGIPQPAAMNSMVLNKNSFNVTNGETVAVTFSSTKAGPAQMMVFNSAGARIRLVDLGPVIPNILYTQLAVWDGTADDKMRVTAGIYIIKIKVGTVEIGTKLVAVKK